MSFINNLHSGWIKVPLKEVCSIYQGYGFPKDLQGNKNASFPFYKVGDISKNVKAGNKYLIECENYINEDILLRLRAKLYPVNTVLFAKVGEALKLNRRAITKLPSIGDNNTIGVKAINEICDDLYLFYFLTQLKLEKYSRATTVPSVRKTDIEEIPFPLPSLSQQQRIVAKIEELFSELDKGIESLKTAHQQLKIYRQAVLKWAFEGKLTNSNIKNDELPSTWQWTTINDICLNVEYGSASKSKETGRIPVLRMGNIQNGKFDWNDLVYTDDEDEIKKYFLKKNDVLFNRTNSPELVGKTAIYKGESPAIFAGYLIRINIRESLINADYLNYFLNSYKAKLYGDKVKSFGVNQSNINGAKLKSYPLPICPIEEQKQVVEEIESRLSVCDKIEETIEQSLKQAEALRQSILKKAFEGKLVPQDPNDEPASKLFERISAAKQATVKLTTKNSKLKIQN